MENCFSMVANQNLLQKKYAIIVNLFAKMAKITRLEALDFFYHSEEYNFISKNNSDLHCIDDYYLAEKLLIEFNQHNKINIDSNLVYDELSSSRQNLTFKVLEKKFREVLGIKSLTSDILKTLGLLHFKTGYSNAAAIFADKNDFSGIEIIRFGENLNEILERKNFSKISVISQLDRAIDIFEQNYCFEIRTNIGKEKIETIPRLAFCEGLANVIRHKFWDNNINCQIKMFKDRIEINSFGGLPLGCFDEKYLNAKFVVNLRNLIITNVFSLLKYIDKVGIIKIKESYKNSSTKPKFIISENLITVIFPCLDRKIR